MSWHPMVIAAAKELNQRVADSCNVNADDQWALEGEVYISDADAMLKAAGVNFDAPIPSPEGGPTLTDEQIDKLLHALDDVALNFGDDLPGLALNSRGLERSRAVARAALAAQPQPESLLMKLAGIAAECTDPDTTDALDALIADTPTRAEPSPAEGDERAHNAAGLADMLRGIADEHSIELTDLARRALDEAANLLSQPQPKGLTITPLEEQQMFDDWCPYKGNPDPRVVWAAAIEAVNGMQLQATQAPAPGADDARDAARWRTFIGLDYAIRSEWAANLSLAPVLTQWVDNASKEQP